MWRNPIFRHCLSFSLMISGIGFSLLSIYFADAAEREIIPEIAIAAGFLLNPNLDIERFTLVLRHLIAFLAAALLLLFDFMLIENHVIVQGNPFLYLLALLLTILLLTYYIFISYQIISIAFRKIRANSNSIVKWFKYISTALGFFISVATFVHLMLEIYELIG